MHVPLAEAARPVAPQGVHLVITGHNQGLVAQVTLKGGLTKNFVVHVLKRMLLEEVGC